MIPDLCPHNTQDCLSLYYWKSFFQIPFRIPIYDISWGDLLKEKISQPPNTSSMIYHMGYKKEEELAPFPLPSFPFPFIPLRILFLPIPVGLFLPSLSFGIAV